MNGITDKQELDKLIEDFHDAYVLLGDKYASPAMLDTLIMLKKCGRDADILYVLSNLPEDRLFEGVLDKLDKIVSK